jgi:hypothetical protein
MILRISSLVASLLCASVIAAPPKLIVTEIQYDPSSEESDDQQTEWVEIHNAGDAAVNLKGYQITSGSKAKPHDAKQRFVLGDISIAAGAYLVIGVGDKSDYEEFDLPSMAAYCGEARYAWLTNESDSVAIRDADGEVIDEVIYQATSPWPVIKGSGSTLQFLAPAGEDPAEANDDPRNWVASNSTNSESYPKHGRGTPGAAPKKSGATTRPSEKSKPATRPSKSRTAAKS